jgi:hypothetical protein
MLRLSEIDHRLQDKFRISSDGIASEMVVSYGKKRYNTGLRVNQQYE